MGRQWRAFIVQRIEYRTIDKSQWGEGPWQNEPDKIQWKDEETGYPCLIRRSDAMGFLCGYVGVSPGHPLYGQHYDMADVDVHGGPTFAGGCSGGPEEDSVCHVPAAGEPDHVWWIGFDCMGINDFPPAYEKYVGRPWPTLMGRGEYRDIAYVTSECQKLAKQLKAMEK